MTKQQREICAELARRMGFSVEMQWSHFYLLDPHGNKEENADGYVVGNTSEADAWMNAPNPFTDAADNRALVAWLAAQDDSIKMRFVRGLRDAVIERDMCYEMAILTAPLETIAIAAAKALGIEAE